MNKCSQTLAYLLLGCIITLNSCSKNEPEKLKVIDFINNYNLVWEDNFNGQEIDSKKWNYRHEGVIRKFATVSRESVKLDGKGNLKIYTTNNKGQYYVGQLATNGLFTQKYGYFECRAQMHKNLGTHSAFWLQSDYIKFQNNDPKNNGVEIDIFEYHRKNPKQVYHNIHWNGYELLHKQIGTMKYIPTIETGYHTFGLLWTDKEYIFFVDGEETWRTNQPISHIPEYIILSTELTGFGGNPKDGIYPDSVLFDYVKVYQKK